MIFGIVDPWSWSKLPLMTVVAGLLIGAAGCDGAIGGGGDSGAGDSGTSGDGPVVKLDGKGDLDGPPAKLDAPAAKLDGAAKTCQPIPGVSYTARPASNPSAKDPALHGDVNLLLRKKQAVSATKGLISVGGPTDSKAPQLYTLFTDDRVPSFPNVYQVQAWDWSCDCAKGWLTSPEVTLAGMGAKAGEVIRTPLSGYDIGAGHTAMVLYAAPGTITLKYTAEDNVVYGYTIHLSGICVEPALQTLYDQCHAAGRKTLPVLKSRQPLGRSLGAEIQAAIRDTGSWMDPRVKKDWWQGK